MKQLFDYQIKQVEQVLAEFEKGIKSVLMVSLMGSGKTVMAADLIHKCINTERRVLFLVDLNCLIDQVTQELWKWQVPCSVLQGNRDYNPSMPCTVASIQTVDARVRRHGIEERTALNIKTEFFASWLGRFDLIILDEAHTVSYRSCMAILREVYLEKNACFLGLTATPWRLNPNEYLGQYYQSCVIGLQPPELIKIGKSVPCRIYHFDDFFDLNSIALGKDGDYAEHDMEKQATSTAHLEKVYEEWNYRTPSQSTIGFASSVKHAKLLCEFFTNKGVSSGVVTASTKDVDRKDLFRRLSNGEITVLFSVNVLTAGFDSPVVSSILYVCLTKSKAKYHQAVGRAARVFPGKEYYTILDFGNNCKEHGSPMSFQDYSIKQKSVGKRDELLKLCPNCSNWVFKFVRICPDCGHEFVSEKEENEAPEFTEIELNIPMIEYFCREDCERLAFFRSEKRNCFNTGISPDIAGNLFYEKYGYRPPVDWALQAVFGATPNQSNMNQYRAYLEQFAPHDFWIKVQMKYEFGDFSTSKSKKKKHARERPTKLSSTINWFDVLGVTVGASFSEVKSAYRKLAATWHPDICKEPGAEAQMKQINWAYDYYQMYFGEKRTGAN